MMHILRALIYKDYLLLVRDRAGLCMMFAMPMLLVAIMTCLQDSTFNSINETRIPLLLLNDDRDTLGVAIERQIESSGIFAVSRTLDGRNPDRDELVRAVARGDFMIGMVIPARTTEHIRQHVRQYVENLFSGEEAPLPADSSLQVEIFLDPVTKSSFRVTLLSTLREYASRTESELMLKEITREVNRLSPVTIPAFRLSDNRIVVREEYALSGKRGIIPNSVQHNVPAWSMFAVFFIAISLSGHLIKERDDGSFARLLTMPCPYYLYLLSKVIVYMAVCLLQFAAIFMMGMYLFPLLDLPALTLDVSPALLLTGVCSALAAIGYGAAIGRIATSHQQAAIFASVSIVIMAAVGGIWIPVFIMPHPMQLLSALSPLNWGLEAFYDLFVRGGGFFDILPECTALLLFAALCTAAAGAYEKLSMA